MINVTTRWYARSQGKSYYSWKFHRNLDYSYIPAAPQCGQQRPETERVERPIGVTNYHVPLRKRRTRSTVEYEESTLTKRLRGSLHQTRPSYTCYHTWTNEPRDLDLYGDFSAKEPNLSTDFNVPGLKPIIKESDGDMFLLTDSGGKLYVWDPWDGHLLKLEDRWTNREGMKKMEDKVDNVLEDLHWVLRGATPIYRNGRWALCNVRCKVGLTCMIEEYKCAFLSTVVLGRWDAALLGFSCEARLYVPTNHDPDLHLPFRILDQEIWMFDRWKRSFQICRLFLGLENTTIVLEIRCSMSFWCLMTDLCKNGRLNQFDGKTCQYR